MSAAALLAAASRFDAGEEHRRAAELLRRELGAAEVLLVDRGRSALQLAISLATEARHSNRIVALPAYQCFELATAAVGADCRVALYDVDPGTMGPDLASVERLLQSGDPPQAIVVASLFGLPADWDAVSALARRYGATVIEDAAQGDGARWRDRPLGAHGDLSVLSFGRGKGWTGSGGGALCLRGPFVGRIQSLAGSLAPSRVPAAALALVAGAAQWALGRPSFYWVPAGIPALGLGETEYHPPTRPAAPSGFTVALLQRTLTLCRRERDVRRANAERWRALLPPDVMEGVPAVIPGAAPGYLRFPVVLSSRASVTHPILECCTVDWH